MKTIKQILAWVLPRVCVSCGLQSDDPDLDLCSYCRITLPWLSNRCYQCGLTIEQTTEAIICNKCQSTQPPFNRLCALFDYKPPIIKLVNSLKFGQQLYPGKLFGKLLAEAIVQKWYVKQQLPQLIIPVPLHSSRHRKRGYNQAAEISLPIAKQLNIPIAYDVCVRHKKTLAQAQLKREVRKKNLDSAFTVTIKPEIKHVALVDDVVTTGSTVRAVSKALITAGVEVVDVWCVCRA